MPSRTPISAETYDLQREIAEQTGELYRLRSGHGMAVGAFVQEKARAKRLIAALQPDQRRRMTVEQIEAAQRQLDLTLGGIKAMAEREQASIAAHAEGLEKLRGLVANARERDPESFSPRWFPQGVEGEFTAVFQDDLAELREEVVGLLDGA